MIFVSGFELDNFSQNVFLGNLKNNVLKYTTRRSSGLF